MDATLSTDLDDPRAIPYFLWDDPMSAAELRERLRTLSPPERHRLLGKILREARDSDVWRFTTPAEVRSAWAEIEPHLGRRRGFWTFLFAAWRDQGLFDPAPQARDEKPIRGKIRIDPPEEILANKLCALLSRSELRDVVDVLELERAGYPMDSALPWAMKKDSGMTPAQLAWVLSQIHIADDARIPGARSPEEVREYLADLRARLARLAMPR
jgi:hypothetical protein